MPHARRLAVPHAHQYVLESFTNVTKLGCRNYTSCKSNLLRFRCVRRRCKHLATIAKLCYFAIYSYPRTFFKTTPNVTIQLIYSTGPSEVNYLELGMVGRRFEYHNASLKLVLSANRGYLLVLIKKWFQTIKNVGNCLLL